MKARKSIIVEAYRHDIRDLANPVKSRVALTVIDGWMKLIVPGPAEHHQTKRKFAELAGGIELFDLKHDPLEQKNLAEQMPEEVARLKAMLEAQYGVLPAPGN